jgi:hypothetical protein
MKTLIVGLALFTTSSFVNHTKPEAKAKAIDGYSVTLLSNGIANGNYEWIWQVVNPNPGNGRDGTLQDLSHWDLALGSCVTQNDLVGAAYSTDGINWHALPAIIAKDPSISVSCWPTEVMKFDQGLDGSAVTYFKLIVNKPFTRGGTMAVFKSGKALPCYSAGIDGIACEEGPNR